MVDVVGGVGSGEEEGFELGGGQIDTGSEHSVEVTSEGFGITVQGIIVTVNGFAGEEQAGHAADALILEGQR